LVGNENDSYACIALLKLQNTIAVKEYPSSKSNEKLFNNNALRIEIGMFEIHISYCD